MLLKLSLHRRMEGNESWESKASTSPPLSAEHQESNMFQQWRIYPILQTFGQSPTTPEHHEEHSPQRYRCHSSTYCQLVFTSSDDESPAQHSSTNASSPAHRSADLSSPEHHNQHHYCTSTQNMEQFFTDVNGVAWDDDTTFLQGNLPNSTYWMMKSGLKIQFQIDSCTSMRPLMSQITSVPTPVHTAPHPSE